jgi:hypothetical protein
VQVVGVTGSDGKIEVTASPRPVLSPEVLRQGMLELQAENLKRLGADRFGEPVVRAQHRLQQGLAETDRMKRAQLLGAQLPARSK